MLIKRIKAITTVVLAAAWLLAATGTAVADTSDQAKRIHDRIAGVPPDDTTLGLMVGDINTLGPIAGPKAAAFRAMENPNFYSVTLKNMATPWTNRDQTVFADLNDYTATFIGMVRDGIGMDQLLSANLIYHANGTVVQNAGFGPDNAPPYSDSNNDHYEWLEKNGVDLAAELQSASQTAMSALDSNATAGIMTTRAAAEAFFVAGTNRAMFRFTLLNHMCTDLEQIKDTTRSPDRVRQDVSRSPGGDSRIFLNNCVGCHAGMDPLAQAFAYYQYNEATGALEYSAPTPQAKYSINEETFSPGYVTPNDNWENYWRTGPNEHLGWDTGRNGFGSGAKSMGEELANSRTFATCQVKKVFRAVCLRDPVDGTEHSMISDWTDAFVAPSAGPDQMGSYKLKPVFAEAAAYCQGS